MKFRNTFLDRIADGLEIINCTDEKGNQYSKYAWYPECDCADREKYGIVTRFYSGLLKHVVKHYEPFYDPWERDIMADDVQRNLLMNSLKMSFIEKYVGLKD